MVKKESKALEILALVIAILSLILSGYVGIKNMNLNEKVIQLQEDLADFQKEQTKQNNAIKKYEMAKSEIQWQEEMLNEGNSNCINQSILTKNYVLLNNMKKSIQDLDPDSAQNNFQKMDLITCPIIMMEMKKQSFMWFWWLLVFLIINLIILFILFRLKKF